VRRRKKEGLIKKVHKFCSGDEVEFKLKPSFKDSSKFEAYDIKFIRNERRELCMSIDAFIPTPKSLTKEGIDNFYQYKKGDVVLVRLKHIHNERKVSLTLAD
jgi:hypothetical protein